MRNAEIGNCPLFAAPTRVGVETRFAWNSEIRPYFVPRWRDFEGFSRRSKIKEGLEGLGKGFRLRR